MKYHTRFKSTIKSETCPGEPMGEFCQSGCIFICPALCADAAPQPGCIQRRILIQLRVCVCLCVWFVCVCGLSVRLCVWFVCVCGVKFEERQKSFGLKRKYSLSFCRVYEYVRCNLFPGPILQVKDVDFCFGKSRLFRWRQQ